MVILIVGINWYLLENYLNNIWFVFIIFFWLIGVEILVVYCLNGFVGSGVIMVYMMS